jgi:uncharacterized protein DUF1707/cell wall-active antibiotic response 4TMS protein YvqF
VENAQPEQQPGPDELALRRRVSDLEREDAADVLREAAGEGRLSYVELEDRLEQTYQAKTYGELVKVTADLPNGLTDPTRAPQPAAATWGAVQPASSTIKVLLSDTKRSGPWIAPERVDVNAVLGEVTLDYTEAQIQHRELYIDISAVMADVTIRVPPDAIVDLDGTPILGSVKEQGGWSSPVQPASVDSRVFHIRAKAVLAEVKVKRGPSVAKRLLGGR